MTTRETKSDLAGHVDHYNGVIVSSSSLPDDPEMFSILLQGLHSMISLSN
jgi:hypothetical protein